MKRVLAIGVLALCLITSQIARADEKRDAKIKAEIVQNYLLWQEAYKNKDAERIISFESSDFTQISEVGQVASKADNDKVLREGMSQVHKVYEAHIEIKKLRIEPNRVVVWAKQYMDADWLDPQKQPHRVSFIRSTKDIWVQYDGIWMLKRMEELASKMVADGKPVS